MTKITRKNHPLMLKSRAIIDDLMENNLGWQILNNEEIPIEIHTRDGKWLGRIVFENPNKIPPKQLIITDGLKTFGTTVVPKKIQIRSKLFEADKSLVKNILLHELNHWYTYTKYGFHVRPHGNEFKRCAKIINLDPAFDGRKIYGNDYGLNLSETYHTAKCTNCGKVVCGYKRKSTVMKKLDKYESSCCKSKIIYGGTKTYS